MTRRSHIGFDRRLDLEWLDAAAAQAAAGTPAETMRTYLWNLLDGVVSGDKFNSARGKTVTVLNHIWGERPNEVAGLREHAIALLPESAADDRLALHWAMMVGTYPVFTDVAAATGRLLTLQGSFTLAHLTRRLVGTWGERSTLQRAVQLLFRTTGNHYRRVLLGCNYPSKEQSTHLRLTRLRAIEKIIAVFGTCADHH